MKKRVYTSACAMKVLPVLLEEDLLGGSIYRNLSPVQIDGQESAGEYDYTSSSFNDVWID